jgi:hypothetical protein
MGLQKPRLPLGQSPHLSQCLPNHLPRALLLRCATRSLPDAYYGGLCRGHEPLHRFDQIPLETGAAQLAVCKDVHANAALTFEHRQNGAIFNVL